MKKKIKKLEYRNDIMDLWVSKGAVLNKKLYQKVRFHPDIDVSMFMTEGKGRYVTNIYEILYSPESNFFDVMFGKVRDGYHKKNCVDSPDHLAYLLDKLNETTS